MYGLCLLLEWGQSLHCFFHGASLVCGPDWWAQYQPGEPLGAVDISCWDGRASWKLRGSFSHQSVQWLSERLTQVIKISFCFEGHGFISCWAVSNSLRNHGLPGARLLCQPLSPRVYSQYCPLIWWCSLPIPSSTAPFSFCLQSFLASVFSSELALCIWWPKYWSFSFSISPSSEYSGLISFRIDLVDILAVQGTGLS